MHSFIYRSPFYKIPIKFPYNLPCITIDTPSSYLFHDGGRYHIETSSLICRANQWTSFYMITASVMKELNISYLPILAQCFISLSPENVRKPSDIFRGFRNETLIRNLLIHYFSILITKSTCRSYWLIRMLALPGLISVNECFKSSRSQGFYWIVNSKIFH